MNHLQRPETPEAQALVPIHHGLRFVEDKATGHRWFVARDICDRLGTDAKDIPAILGWDAYRPLGALRGIPSIEGINKLAGLRRDTRMLSEPGFYRLVFRSRKPEAVRFQIWIAGEVVPSIMKYGCYFVPDLCQQMLDNPDTAIELAQKLIADREERERYTRLNQQDAISAEEENGLIIDVTPQVR